MGIIEPDDFTDYHEEIKKRRYYEYIKITIVPFPNAFASPRTMMIPFHHTYFAILAMIHIFCRYHIAFCAKASLVKKEKC